MNQQLESQLGTSVKEMIFFSPLSCLFFLSLSLTHLLIFSQFHRLLNTVNHCIGCSRILIRYTVIALKMKALRPPEPLEVPASSFHLHKFSGVLKLTQGTFPHIKIRSSYKHPLSWFLFSYHNKMFS